MFVYAEHALKACAKDGLTPFRLSSLMGAAEAAALAAYVALVVARSGAPVDPRAALAYAPLVLVDCAHALSFFATLGDRGAVLLAQAVETRRQERVRTPGLPTVTIMLWGNQLQDPDTERTIAEVDAVGRAEGGDWVELNRSPHHFSPTAAAAAGQNYGDGYVYAPSSCASTPPYSSGTAGVPWTPPPSRYGMH